MIELAGERAKVDSVLLGLLSQLIEINVYFLYPAVFHEPIFVVFKMMEDIAVVHQLV